MRDRGDHFPYNYFSKSCMKYCLYRNIMLTSPHPSLGWGGVNVKMFFLRMALYAQIYTDKSCFSMCATPSERWFIWGLCATTSEREFAWELCTTSSERGFALGLHTTFCKKGVCRGGMQSLLHEGCKGLCTTPVKWGFPANSL